MILDSCSILHAPSWYHIKPSNFIICLHTRKLVKYKTIGDSFELDVSSQVFMAIMSIWWSSFGFIHHLAATFRRNVLPVSSGHRISGEFKVNVAVTGKTRMCRLWESWKEYGQSGFWEWGEWWGWCWASGNAGGYMWVASLCTPSTVSVFRMALAIAYIFCKKNRLKTNVLCYCK